MICHIVVTVMLHGVFGSTCVTKKALDYLPRGYALNNPFSVPLVWPSSLTFWHDQERLFFEACYKRANSNATVSARK